MTTSDSNSTPKPESPLTTAASTPPSTPVPTGTDKNNDEMLKLQREAAERDIAHNKVSEAERENKEKEKTAQRLEQEQNKELQEAIKKYVDRSGDHNLVGVGPLIELIRNLQEKGLEQIIKSKSEPGIVGRIGEMLGGAAHDGVQSLFNALSGKKSPEIPPASPNIQAPKEPQVPNEASQEDRVDNPTPRP